MHVAVDLGAESARVVRGRLAGGKLLLDEVLRVRNQPQKQGRRLTWDVEGLFEAVVAGLRAAGKPASIGIAGWGVDFGLLGADGSLTAPPRAYRDRHTAGILPRLFELVPAEQLYARTGIQMMEINTICQLLALAEAGAPELKSAARMLLIPDLLMHWLGADAVSERTNASTTQLLAAGGGWAADLFEAIGVDSGLAAPLVAAGTRLGRPSESLDLGRAELVAAGTHDTASAVAGIPFETGRPAAFISSGTWSLVGMELPAPVLTEDARARNLSNEEGVGSTTRLLRNVMGLWLVQRCLEAWRLGPADGVALAESAPPGAAFFDVDDPSLLRAPDMPAAIARLAGLDPSDRPGLLRAALDSLALRYRGVLDALVEVTGVRPEVVHVVGGGSRNELLCRLTADACDLPVLAGPVEATSIGNLAVQLIALGEVASLEEARRLVARSFPVRVYEPRGAAMAETEMNR